MTAKEEQKRKAMKAIKHPETGAMMRKLRLAVCKNPEPAPAPGKSIKERAMKAISHIETIRQFGAMRTIAGAAVYAAHISQVDREAGRQPTRAKDIHTMPREHLGRDL